MLKLPKGLKKKKKGKKSKRKGEEELFTEEELEKYRREHQHQQSDVGEGSVKENEEWSKFKDLTTGVDSILKKTQGDLDRIKSTSFFQRVPAGRKEVESVPKEKPQRPVVEITEADFPQLVQGAAADEDGDRSEFGLTEEESDEDEHDDIFDTSYVEAVERGEVKLAYVPDSPDQFQDDDIFDTSHVDALIKGHEAKTTKGKKTLDIGVAVEVLTGRIDNVTVTTKRSKRVIPGDLLLETNDKEVLPLSTTVVTEPIEKSILDIDADIPITTPIDLSVSLHTSLIQREKTDEPLNTLTLDESKNEKDSDKEQEIDEFTLLAAESLEGSSEVTRLESKEIKLEPVVQESWSAFEADKNESVFADCIVEDQIDVVDLYGDQDDPFDTSFADAVVPSTKSQEVCKEAVILEDDDDFDPRAEEVRVKLNNRRKSSVRIHLINPSGVRESITSDDVPDKEDEQLSRDLLGGSTTDLTQLGHSPLDPLGVNNADIDPFDTTIVDKIVAPGKVELKLLEKELIGSSPTPVYRVPSDPDFDPRADEPKKTERRASRPENLTVSKSVVFNIDADETCALDTKPKVANPVTPYYTRELSITEDADEDSEVPNKHAETLVKTRSSENLASKVNYSAKRRHSEHPQLNYTVSVGSKTNDLFVNEQRTISAKVLTPAPTEDSEIVEEQYIDPFDTSFATAKIAPSKTELKLLAKEFSCEEPDVKQSGEYDFLEPSDDFFQVKALSPEPSEAIKADDDFDPFDTSFTGNLNPGKTELKLLESEFLG